jgi:hypothetical protein
VRITGLPFAAVDYGFGSMLVLNLTYVGELTISPVPGQTYLTVYVSATGTAGGVLDCTGVPDTGAFYFTVTYQV